jgi:hypothetical protein
MTYASSTAANGSGSSSAARPEGRDATVVVFSEVDSSGLQRALARVL